MDNTSLEFWGGVILAVCALLTKLVDLWTEKRRKEDHDRTRKDSADSAKENIGDAKR